MNVEAAYRERVRAMTAAEKMRRAEELFEWARAVQARAIVAEHGPMPPDRLRRELALRQYGADAAMRRLIARLGTRASG